MFNCLRAPVGVALITVGLLWLGYLLIAPLI